MTFLTCVLPELAQRVPAHIHGFYSFQSHGSRLLAHRYRDRVLTGCTSFRSSARDGYRPLRPLALRPTGLNRIPSVQTLSDG